MLPVNYSDSLDYFISRSSFLISIALTLNVLKHSSRISESVEMLQSFPSFCFESELVIVEARSSAVSFIATGRYVTRHRASNVSKCAVVLLLLFVYFMASRPKEREGALTLNIIIRIILNPHRHLYAFNRDQTDPDQLDPE